MKKYISIGLAVLLAAGTGMAQSKINTRGQQILDLIHQGKIEFAGDLGSVHASSRGEYAAAVLVETGSQSVLDSLSAEGYEIEYISDNFSIVHMPLSGVEQLAKSPKVETLSFGEVFNPLMDNARTLSKVTSVHNGTTLNKKYKGEGVIVGMMDTGFDPGHVNFYNSDQSKSRLRYYARFASNNGTAAVYRGDECATAPTDNASQDHGSHVAGIMGGAYNGPGSYKGAKGKLGVEQGKVPLYGVAPEAELAIGAGDLYDANILMAVRKIIDYAKGEGKPVAINLSLGSNYGPHDGTDATTRALDDLGKEAIICIASGNEGEDQLHAGKTFSAGNTELKVLVNENKGRGRGCVWASNNESFTIGFAVVNSVDGSVIAQVNSEPGRTVTIGTSSNTSAENKTFMENFSGTISITGKLDNTNKRYNYDYNVSNVAPKAGKNTYLAMVVNGKDGQHVDIYGNEEFNFVTTMLPGYDQPDNDGSISSMACGKNLIVVGAYNSRDQWYSILSGEGYGLISGYGEGAIAPYSSWGKLLDGRELPHICAPGTGIFSSDNGSFVSSNFGAAGRYVVASAEFNGKTHYWCTMQGTSMACPYVTGTMALWLEADPNLTAEKAREIMAKTATTSGITLNTKWGAGKLNAWNGIREVIKQKNSGIEDIVTGDSQISYNIEGGIVRVMAMNGNGISAELYNLAGLKFAEANSTGDSVELDVTGASKGVYILRITAGGETTSHKIAL